MSECIGVPIKVDGECTYTYYILYHIQWKEINKSMDMLQLMCFLCMMAWVPSPRATLQAALLPNEDKVPPWRTGDGRDGWLPK